MKRLLLLCMLLLPLQAVAIEQDKFKHFAAGMGISIAADAIHDGYGVVAGCAAGLAKEGYDSQGHGTVEAADFAYTCLGAGVASWLGNERSTLYAVDASLIVLDGISTIMARHNGGIEVGPVAVALIGNEPSDLQVAAFTALNLGILEWSRSWTPALRDGFQWTIALTRPGVIRSNIQINF